MSHEPPYESEVTTHASTGAGWKWLAGAVLAAALIGGGYYAWQNLSQSGPEVASNEASFDQVYGDPGPDMPLPSGETAASEASGESAPAPAEQEAQPAALPQPARRQASLRAVPVPEEVVGVTPARAVTQEDAITQESEPIIVQGVRRPTWTYAPSARRLSAAYPQRALESGREGEASLRCTVEESGALDCVRVSETPRHAGFGRAALRVARMFRHATQRADGSAAAGSAVNLRVVFRVAEHDRRG
jgi:TonB family protein